LKETQDFVGSLPIVPVIQRSSEAELITYAMLDNCSTGTFILEEFQHKLKVDGINSQVLVKTRLNVPVETKETELTMILLN
jgi:hypothetical protein